MTPRDDELADTADPPHQLYWSKAAAAAGGAGAAVATIAATLHGSGAAGHFWTSGPMLVGYGLVFLAVSFFFLGLAGCPFPLANGVKRKRQHGPGVVLPEPSASPVPPRSELREALEANGVGIRELPEALDATGLPRRNLPRRNQVTFEEYLEHVKLPEDGPGGRCPRRGRHAMLGRTDKITKRE
jgi:hypothetical protein